MDTKTIVRKMSVQDFLSQYYKPEQFAESCNACPSFGRVWSCPPQNPDTRRFFAPFSEIVLIGIQVFYDDALQQTALENGSADKLREQIYEPAKRSLLEALLCLEKQCRGAIAIAAGRCEQCPVCMREQGKPCCKPQRMRYSFSAFRVDLTQIAEQELKMPLIWSTQGLPPYQVAIGALLIPTFAHLRSGRSFA